jgi:hypothetical protein
MRQDGPPPSSNAFTIQHVRQVSPELAVAEVILGPVRISSIWIAGCDTPEPRVAWPRSGRGFPVVSVSSDRLREAIEHKLLEVVKGWPAASEGRA